MKSFTKLPGRAGELYKGPAKAPVLPYTFMKSRYDPCYISQRKDPVQSSDFYKGPEKTPALSLTFLKYRKLPQTFTKERNLSRWYRQG